MQQLTMDYDKFTRIMSDNGQQLSRVQVITYDDLHNTVNKAMRKDPDPLLSCIKWMEDFEENDPFTYYNRSLGILHQFINPIIQGDRKEFNIWRQSERVGQSFRDSLANEHSSLSKYPRIGARSPPETERDDSDETAIEDWKVLKSQ
ncbi:hypothetical protein KVV02_002864 [Mortierella alpina]|uniref:Uncharacterized protein n=1 Tax=Mortierella alpina TaxID=64518 RepID=A0A9P7ZW57_MORAP|nr:hypothetical protein KVV02_002864 [Mortierella alpina]